MPCMARCVPKLGMPARVRPVPVGVSWIDVGLPLAEDAIGSLDNSEGLDSGSDA